MVNDRGPWWSKLSAMHVFGLVCLWVALQIIVAEAVLHAPAPGVWLSFLTFGILGLVFTDISRMKKGGD